MKTLGLIRHAKSSWDNHTLLDIDRPLNHRGQRDLQRMPHYLKDLKFHPDLMLTSPAIRARTTAIGFANILGYSQDKIQIIETLYGATLIQLLAIIEKIKDAHNSVALFGHNPVFTEAVNYLTDRDLDNLPTCSIAIISLPIDSWYQINATNLSQGKLEHLFFPNMSGAD
ncbi:MAG TPA: phosphohistidine phosphatase [Gammaproteobacteria bacterium]|nr:phosphohistidine phosphatase [Gammaproteobacteria bacterium]